MSPVLPSWKAPPRAAARAAAAASRRGLPVVLKIQSEQIIHKSDIGGVALRLDSEAEVRAAFEKVYCAGRAVAGAVIDGVLVTPMRSGGLERDSRDAEDETPEGRRASIQARGWTMTIL